MEKKEPPPFLNSQRRIVYDDEDNGPMNDEMFDILRSMDRQEENSNGRMDQMR